MEKVILFMDYANINRAGSSKGMPLDYRNLLDYMGEGRFLIDSYSSRLSNACSWLVKISHVFQPLL